MKVRSRAALILTSALTLVLRAHTGAAQTVTAPAITATLPATAPVAQQQQVGPTFSALSVGVHASIPAATTAPPRGSAGLGQSEAMMIVGGAAILVGAIVGGKAGDIFMIGGAIVGLYGLYKYLQ